MANFLLEGVLPLWVIFSSSSKVMAGTCYLTEGLYCPVLVQQLTTAQFKEFSGGVTVGVDT